MSLGLCGYNWSGTISNCYATGSVTVGVNSYFLGGLCGVNYGTISNSYATGSVSGDFYDGGLCGYNWSGTIINCFWDVQTSGVTYSDGGTGKTTAQMQTQSTFTDAGWDFVDEIANGTDDFWDICDGTNYPKLAWQIPIAGDFMCPDGVNMFDFAVLGDAWFSDPNLGNWDPACDISEPNDNVIDGFDLEVFTDNWLAGIE
jgi:hypothetical protein